MRRERQTLGPFVMVPKAIMARQAWPLMSPGARLLWIELRGHLRNDFLNNGKQFLSCRTAAKKIGADKSTIVNWYAELEHYGFLRKTAGGFLGCEGFGIAAKYRFTDLAYGTHPPTRDFEKWDGVLFDGRSQKQNPVRKKRTPRTEEADIAKPLSNGSLCTENADQRADLADFSANAIERLRCTAAC
jgi:DNA-binding transcriptional MocR family regulator